MFATPKAKPDKNIINILVVGNKASGKSNLMLWLKYDAVAERYIETSRCDYTEIAIEDESSDQVKTLKLTEIKGEEFTHTASDIIVICVDSSKEDIKQQANNRLSKIPSKNVIIAITKTDLITPAKLAGIKSQLKTNLPIVTFSAATGVGGHELLNAIGNHKNSEITLKEKKQEILNNFKIKPDEEAIPLLQKALYDENDPNGKILWTPRGLNGCSITRGTLAKVAAELKRRDNSSTEVKYHLTVTETEAPEPSLLYKNFVVKFLKYGRQKDNLSKHQRALITKLKSTLENKADIDQFLRALIILAPEFNQVEHKKGHRKLIDEKDLFLAFFKSIQDEAKAKRCFDAYLKYDTAFKKRWIRACSNNRGTIKKIFDTFNSKGPSTHWSGFFSRIFNFSKAASVASARHRRRY